MLYLFQMLRLDMYFSLTVWEILHLVLL
ncbi:hypothetical protein LINPERHAP2_LOCUS5017 [Linum perenne]